MRVLQALRFLAASATLAICLPVTAGQVTLSTDQSRFDAGALNQGWWIVDQVNNGNPLNDNHTTGFFDSYRSFYTFDLSNQKGTILGMTLRVMRGVQTGPVTLSLWDVSTAADIVNANYGSNNVAVFNDLGTGISYGTYFIAEGASSDYLSLSLNLNAVNDANASARFFTIGARVDDGFNIFNNTGGDITYLDLQLSDSPADVPEPSSIALIGIALAGLARVVRRKA